MEKFIEFVKSQCDNHGIKFYLSGKDHVNLGSTKCNGYFDEHLKILAVADGKDSEVWHKTLVHEYAHMTQWLDNCEIWNAGRLNELITTETILDLWLAHQVELTKEQLDDYVNRSRAIEVDCEWRTIELIKKHNLSIDIKEYSRRANAYMYFWTAMKHFRRWYVIGREPYVVREVLDAMSDTLQTNEEYGHISPSILELMGKCI